MNRFLITTALEDTWRDDEPVLFLGEWCRRYSQKNHWSRLDAEVLPYHWDDRARLYADYQYLQGFHERLLKDLTAQLNQIHRVDHSPRYWRILIGPWLGHFSQALFDRWTSIQQAVSRYELGETIVLTGDEDALIPNDMARFNSLFVDDAWNHSLYGSILRRFTTVRCIERARRLPDTSTRPAESRPAWKPRLRGMLARCAAGLASTLGRDQDVFCFATYLSIREEIRLHRRLGQVPQFTRSVAPVRVGADARRRRWVVPGDSRCEYEVCARSLISQCMPTDCLEGYAQLVDQARRLPWPRQPKAIWTSSAEHSDDVFKAWAAQKVEEGSPLVIGQHGGHYGAGRWSFAEEHEIAVSDSYLSWGWSDSTQPKVRPLGQLKTTNPLGVRHAEQAKVLLVTCALPRYSYWMYSVYVAGQYLDYFKDQCTFVARLPEAIRAQVIVRLFPHDWGWSQSLRWRERFPDLHLDEGKSDMNDLLRQSRLCICTYNATTFLESFAMDVPTVMYWNPHHWELRESAIPYFEELKGVGILHESAEAAARHVAAVWDDVGAWWASREVRDVLDHFKARYCHVPADLLDCVEGMLREVVANSQQSCNQ